MNQSNRVSEEVLARLSQETLSLLLERNVSERTLFRSTPALSDVREKINKFAKGNYSIRHESDPHLLGGILTECLRIRQPPLFSPIYDDLLTIDFTSDDPLTIKKRIKACIGSMPAHTIEFVRALFILLYRIRRLTNEDSMPSTLSNSSSFSLSITGNFMSTAGSTSINHPIVSIFCPLLLQPSHSSYMSLRHINESRILRPVVAFLIDDFSDGGMGPPLGSGGVKGSLISPHGFGGGIGGGFGGSTSTISSSGGSCVGSSSISVGYFPQHRSKFVAAAEDSSMAVDDGGRSHLLGDSASKGSDSAPKGSSFSHKNALGGSGSNSSSKNSGSASKLEMDTSTSAAAGALDDNSSVSSSATVSSSGHFSISTSSAVTNFNSSESIRSPRSEDPISQLNLGFLEQRVLDALLNSQIESFYTISMATDYNAKSMGGIINSGIISNGGGRPGTPMPSSGFVSGASSRGGHNAAHNGGHNSNHTSSLHLTKQNAAAVVGSSGASKRFSKRTKMIQDCKAIRYKIQAFEDSFLKQKGGPPSNNDKKSHNMLELYNEYRAIKRLIRDTAAIDIQRFFRLRRAISNNRNSSKTNNINNNSISSSNSSISAINVNVSLGGDTTPAMMYSPMNGAFSDVDVHAKMGGGDRAMQQSDSSGNNSSINSSNIYQLEQVYRQLLEEKKELKRNLKKFDDDFFAAHSRQPKRSDKEMIRPMYQKYNELKVRIDDIESHLSHLNGQQSEQKYSSASSAQQGGGSLASSVEFDMDGASLGNKASSLGTVDNFESRSSSNSNNGNNNRSSSHMPLVAAAYSDDSGDMLSANMSAPSMSIGSDGGISDPSQSLLLLIEEKKTLHNFLKDFEREFNQVNGRPVTRHDDILPVAEQYQRYKDLKVIIKEMKNT